MVRVNRSSHPWDGKKAQCYYQADGLQLPSHQTYLGYVFIYYLIYLFLREKARVSGGNRQQERERENPKDSTPSTDPKAELNLTTLRS